MHYVKQFDINGVATKQVGCIELHGKPNGATEGAVGVLGIDVDSPLHDVYKCVAVNGSIYTWELLSSGLSIMSATITGGGEESVRFPYANLKTPELYVVKVGDLILDSEGYLYQIDTLNTAYCTAKYCGTQVVAYGKSAYALAVENGFEGSEEEWLGTLKGEKGNPGEGLIIVPITSKDGGATYTATIPELTSLYNGLEITIIPNVSPKSASATLDVNGLGAKVFRMQYGTNAGNLWGAIHNKFIAQNRPCKVIYDGSSTGFWRLPTSMASADDFQGKLAITKGGTGATTAAAALLNLGGASIVKGSYTGTGDGTSAELSFDVAPKLLVVFGTTAYGYVFGIASPDGQYGTWKHGDNDVCSEDIGVTFTENKVTIGYTMFVTNGVTYSYTAICG